MAELREQVTRTASEGATGIAHTRWATHGAGGAQRPPALQPRPRRRRRYDGARPSPGAQRHHREPRRAARRAEGSAATLPASQTDTEVIAHLVDSPYDGDLFEAVQAAIAELHGAYAIGVFCRDEPHRVVGARGSPLILGVGAEGRNFLASDAMALAGVTDQIVYLEEATWSTCSWAATGSGRRPPRSTPRARGQDRARPQRRGRAGPLPPLHAEEIFEQPAPSPTR